MPNLRLITSDAVTKSGATSAGDAVVAERPRVSLRLLMAASGRCSCDDCLLAYRAGNRRAGIIEVSRRPARLAAVR
jgi:hypothetical protein